MKKYLLVIITILLISFFVDAQTPSPTFTPTPSPSPSPRPDQLTEKDTADVSNFTVNVISAELLCEISGAKNSVKFKVVFDQTFDEIKRVSSVFGKPNLLARFSDPNSYHLMNLANGNKLDLSKIPEENELNYITFILSDADAETFDSDKNKKYSLFLRGLNLNKGATAEKPSMTSVAVSSSCADIPANFGAVAPIEAKSPPTLYEYAKKNFQPDKSSPEVKVSFAMNGERVTSPFYSTVIAAEPFELKRLGLHGAYSIVPVFFNLERNDTPGSEVDKLKFGGKFRHLIVFEDDGKYTTGKIKTSPLIGIRSEITAGFEGTTKFKSPKIIIGLKTGLPINLFQTRSHSMRVMPFVGFDVGYKLVNDETATTKERLIARPSFGAEFYYTPYRTEKDAPFLLEMSYIRRAFLKPEEIYTRDANRKPIIEGVTTNPKDYFSLQMTFWQTRFISPFIKYTYGRDTSQYLLEDHKYIFGIQANFDWGEKK